MTKFEEELKRPKKAYIDPFSKRDVDFTGVAQKFTEGAQTLKEWKEYAFLLEDKLKLQQQALPVVPECVGEFVSGDENELSKADRIAYLLKSVQGDSYYLTEELPGDGTITVDEGQELYNWAICQHHETILELWNGYTVEKPQLFYIELPNVYGLSVSVFVSKVENGTILEFSNGKNYALKFTEQEIKAIDPRYWAFRKEVEI